MAECRKELLLERELTVPSSVISLTSNRVIFYVCTQEVQAGDGLINKVPEGTKDLSDIIGGLGRWQLIVFCLVMMMSFLGAFHTLSYQFLFPPQDHWCASPYPQVDEGTWRNYGVPNTTEGPSQCTMYDPGNLTWDQYITEASSRPQVPCKSWYYDSTVYGRSIISEFNLVCHQASLTSLSQTIFMLGFMLAVFFTGQVSDTYGRRPTILICICILLLGSLIGPLAVNISMIMASRFFIGFGISGTNTVIFVVLAEAVSSKYRDILCVGNYYAWSLGYMLIPLFAWIFKDWVHLQALLTACTGLSILMFFLLPESPRWLLARGRAARAHDSITAICKRNKIYNEDKKAEIDDLIAAHCKPTDLEKQDLERPSGTFFDQFRTPNLRKRSLNLYFTWLVAAFVYYGLSYQADRLGGDPYVNVFLSGLVEVPAYTFCIFGLKKIGRRVSTSTELLVGGAACFITLLIPSSLYWLKITLAMIGKLFITACFASIYVYTTELYPTVIRNVGLGTASIFARIGSMVAPFANQLTHDWFESFGQYFIKANDWFESA
ncbi:SLC22A14 [Cordylochernes scorpioides]|uniref:SLC22A14 n=1 Tax=Cordylochernes scorpioides TaxID=51811 RepID=A0ABY6LSZ3_9ARAC|nr:SLC22A14 [Cordylochernes scorpioides]